MNLLITKTLLSIEAELEKEKKETKQSSVSTQLSNRASYANFNVDIAGPASLLSNLVFWGFKDNITIEEHAVRPWVTLNTSQLINYPYVEVEFNSPELSFKRSFEPRINRYMSGCADMLYEKSSFIIGKHRINPTTSKFIFPTSLLQKYIEVYKTRMFSEITQDQRLELSVILDQFCKDMVDININNNVAENRQVTFNIGKNLYKRSKKISNQKDDKEPIVIYNEVFLPRLISSFRYFTGMQEYTLEGKRIVSTKNNGSNMMMNFKPIISYKCTYCKIGFVGPSGMVKMQDHLEKNHQREQPLLCLLCKKSFELTQLSEQRWKCVCQK
ncbi:hypothetical protein HHI36_013846 [Cryptolaemus montrouzieri]|uniref:C2H2-type domain-containing protein n=1 Tax=Cryptolaemus montrouzieri TaxID=559131 RepID=A0ABD2N1S0_9CUCU